MEAQICAISFAIPLSLGSLRYVVVTANLFTKFAATSSIAMGLIGIWKDVLLYRQAATAVCASRTARYFPRGGF
jgi:hypothetical protein